MTKQKSAPKIAPEDVRVHVRLYSGESKKRDVVLPSCYPQFADIVSEVVETGERVHRDELTRKQVDILIDKLYRERDAASRIKNPTAQAGINELIHVVNGMRLYKLRAGRSARIACEAWLAS